MSQQFDKKVTKQVRIDSYWHQILKVDAARAQTTVRELIESCLAESYQLIKENYGLKEI